MNARNNYRILACVVAYDPDNGFEERLLRISRQADETLVVNNYIKRDMSGDFYVTINNGNAGGIAGALNKAVDYAIANNFSYIAIFDHDSEVPEGLIERLTFNLNKFSGTIIGPRYVNSANCKAGRFVLDVKGKARSLWVKDDIGVVPAFFVITSGTVINLSQVIGGELYNEALGLDMVDVDFCLSMKSLGKKILLDTSVCMKHGIGNKKLGSSRFSASGYSMGRFESIICNRVLIWKKWIRFYPRFIISDIMVAVLDFCRNFIFIPTRISYVNAVLRGLRSGIRKSIREK